MALNLTKTDDFGNSVTYWNIGGSDEDFKGQGIHVTIYGYRDQSARQAGLQPSAAVKIQLTSDEYVADANRATLYGIIKQRSDFVGSTDC